MATTKKGKVTSPAIAKKAGKALEDPKTPVEYLGIIASDLSQAEQKALAKAKTKAPKPIVKPKAAKPAKRKSK